MSLLNLLTLASAACAGASMGSFLLLTLINKPVLHAGLKAGQMNRIYGRFYRLNFVLCILAGLLAALIKNQQAALVLTILAASYVFANIHILRGIATHLNAADDSSRRRALDSLYLLQNGLHFMQFVGAGYGIFLFN